VIGKAARRVFAEVPELMVVTTEANIAEVEEYLPHMAAKYGLDVEKLLDALAVMPVERHPESAYLSHVKEARRYLESRDPDDVALAALALKLEIPVWSNDKDFESVPVKLYTTARLLKALGL
jgi:predicted nucleic acid-binding protein